MPCLLIHTAEWNSRQTLSGAFGRCRSISLTRRIEPELSQQYPVGHYCNSRPLKFFTPFLKESIFFLLSLFLSFKFSSHPTKNNSDAGNKRHNRRRLWPYSHQCSNQDCTHHKAAGATRSGTCLISSRHCSRLRQLISRRSSIAVNELVY